VARIELADGRGWGYDLQPQFVLIAVNDAGYLHQKWIKPQIVVSPVGPNH
jgi:hypothetical protein